MEEKYGVLRSTPTGLVMVEGGFATPGEARERLLQLPSPEELLVMKYWV